MISQRAVNYAKILYSLKLKDESVRSAKELLLNNSDLMNILENPVIKKQEKDSVIEVLFEKEIGSYLKVICENQGMDIFTEVMDAYEEIVFEHNDMIKARLAYAIKPDDEELEQIKNMIRDKYKKTEVFLELEEEASLIGGFVLYVGDIEYDKSIKGALSEMQKTLIRR
ncbi:MAG: ATP synthase F1 subunit delta [Herbinix sp.]|nr:ATP synthase F1 subunit delta [Herbinix sp.]